MHSVGDILIDDNDIFVMELTSQPAEGIAEPGASDLRRRVQEIPGKVGNCF